jgi:uncharacterized protein (DUF1499 family)
MRYGAYLGIGLAILALILLGAAPLGWRAGWWHFRFAFGWLMAYSAYAAIAALVVCLLTIALGWSRLDGRTFAATCAALVLAAVLAYVPWQFDRTRKTVPRIHDITTDTEHPPDFIAALPARAAEQANPVQYEGPEVARQQKAAYPDVVPLEAALPPAEAFERALEAANAMRGWTIIDTDPAGGRIEANQSSRWFHFTDDVVIRVVPAGAGSRIDVRSVSRQGRSDFGVNAKRIRAYMAALKPHLA